MENYEVLKGWEELKDVSMKIIQSGIFCIRRKDEVYVSTFFDHDQMKHVMKSTHNTLKEAKQYCELYKNNLIKGDSYAVDRN